MDTEPTDTQPLKPTKMLKYGTFSRLFGTSKTTPDDSDSSASGSDQPAGPPTAAANPQTEPSSASSSPNKRCLRISLIVMLSSSVVLAVGLLAGLLTRHAGASNGGNGSHSTRPNIVFIMTDDQDRRLGSTDYMTVLHRELMAKGTEFTNHYTTQALCCPARSSLLRGQQIHNTNITNVVKPGWVFALTLMLMNLQHGLG